MTALTIHDVLQRSDEWHALRCGIVTASTVGALITPTLRAADNDTVRTLARKLAGDRLTGHTDPDRMSADMWRGIEEEPIARDAYASHHRGVVVREVGFMVRDFGGFRIGYSPDGLVDDDGLIEIKSRLPKVHIGHVLANQIPHEVTAQIQAGLLVSGREWCDHVSCSGGMRLWVTHVRPDPDWHAVILEAVESLEARIEETVAAFLAATAGMPVVPITPDLSDIT